MRLFARSGPAGLRRREVHAVLAEAFGGVPRTSDVDSIFTELQLHEPSATLDRAKLADLLRSPRYRVFDNGRCYCIVSLAEAETIRAIMHARDDQYVIDGSSTAIALRNVTQGGMLMDESHGYRERAAYQRALALQLCRFLDGQLFYDSRELSLLIKTLQHNTPLERQEFFIKLAACRRRGGQSWSDRPVALVIRKVQDEFSLLVDRLRGRAMGLALAASGIPIGTAFRTIDEDENKWIAPGEMLRALLALELPHEVSKPLAP